MFQLITLGTLLVSIAAFIFTLEKRVSLLEQGEKLVHGDLRPYLPK